MASGREIILARLLLIAQGIPGIATAVRNAVDSTGLLRPMIIINDGHEALDVASIGGGVQGAKPASERLSRRQRMTMTPEIMILAYTSEPNIGTLLNLYSERFLAALTQDAELLTALGIDPATKTGLGEIRYDGCLLEPATAASKERRLLLTIVFTYLFQMSGS